ncbi:hypothetical protein AB0B85_22660, partial [Micromonospora sp. NPDC049044]
QANRSEFFMVGGAGSKLAIDAIKADNSVLKAGTDRVTERVLAALGRERFDALAAEGAKLAPGEARAQL